MLTGCRPGEAMKASWEEFDKEPGYWIKPSAHVKQRKTHKLPLNPAAIELVDRLRRKREGNWVFSGDKPGEHLTQLWRVWTFVRRPMIGRLRPPPAPTLANVMSKIIEARAFAKASLSPEEGVVRIPGGIPDDRRGSALVHDP
jgi:integrase